MKLQYRYVQLIRLLVLSLLPLLSACDLLDAATPAPTSRAAAPATAESDASAPATETPPFLPPTGIPSPLPQPTPTHDPALPEWTVLIYMSTDNEYARSALDLIDRMEAAGGAKQVTVIVQIDGRPDGEGDASGQARRYRIRQDDQPGSLASEILGELGEVNMGDPMVLSQFLSWGMAQYPANHHALILRGEGAGWRSLVLDQDVGFPGESDHITPADLGQALADGLAQSGLEKLDLIGFDAGLTSQLDLHDVVQPFADFAVGSASLLAGRGWDYRTWLTWLYENPSEDGRVVAQKLVALVSEYQSRQPYNEAYALAALDLALWPELTHWFEQLAIALTTAPVENAATISAARRVALEYGRATVEVEDQPALVDLGQFAVFLANQSMNEPVAFAARGVADALAASVIAVQTGPLAAGSTGVAVNFPQKAGSLGSAQPARDGLTVWETFLDSHRDMIRAGHPAPQIYITNVLTEAVGAQNPAYLEFELVGRDIDHVALVAGHLDENGRERLLLLRRLPLDNRSTPGEESQTAWRDGLHEQYAVWPTDAIFLGDAAGNGDLVLTWPAQDDASLLDIRGQFRPSGGTAYIESSLVLTGKSMQPVAMWGWADRAVFELHPEEGDEFRPYLHYRVADDSIGREPGPALLFDESGRLHVERHWLPDGDYFMGILAESFPGGTSGQFARLTVSNALNMPGYEAYFDPNHGFQFLYPDSWHLPETDQGVLATSNVTGTTHVQVGIYPGLRRGADENSLTREALERFGPVDLLFPAESIIIAETRGQRTVYGYEDESRGARTGIIVAFVQNGTGFVIDIDGPQADESLTLATAAELAANWTVRPAKFGSHLGEWAITQLESDAELAVAHPVDFLYQTINHWHRFSRDRGTFAAFRFRPAGSDGHEALAELVGDAARGVDAFVSSQNSYFPLSGISWLRSDFTYMTNNGAEVHGFVMVATEEGTETAVWVEAPSGEFESLESELFLLMVADLIARN